MLLEPGMMSCVSLGLFLVDNIMLLFCCLLYFCCCVVFCCCFCAVRSADNLSLCSHNVVFVLFSFKKCHSKYFCSSINAENFVSVHHWASGFVELPQSPQSSRLLPPSSYIPTLMKNIFEISF